MCVILVSRMSLSPELCSLSTGHHPYDGTVWHPDIIRLCVDKTMVEGVSADVTLHCNGGGAPLTLAEDRPLPLVLLVCGGRVGTVVLTGSRKDTTSGRTAVAGIIMALNLQ